MVHKKIEQAFENAKPRQYQIKNDVVLNYEINYEKQLLRYRNLFSLQSNTSVKLGTLFTNASVGLNATLGIINSPFTSVKNKNKFQVYLYSQPVFTAVGYDASLQGGLFNSKSPYTISSNSVERFTAQINFGMVIQTRSLFIEYSRVKLTREFETGNAAKYGGIKIGFKF